ncbi:MAG TPA: YgeY family selenium metabolism-linked hydrolase [Thermoanaerobaculia bacterium]|nr:YgeY family selenium metabolism-linked hydrolase [Thermoanaerobaculia bacterium]
MPSATVDLAAELVRIPSVLGDEAAVAERAAEAMRALGYDTVEIDAAGNVVGVIAGERPGPTVLFDAHLDTVDVEPAAAWTLDPFSGAVRDGRLWGRGASDMKGSLAAMITGLAGLDRAGLAGRAVVSGSVNEELIEGAALRAVMERFPPDTVVIGEATGLDLAVAGRGRAELLVSTRGVPAHASTPAAGVNAVTRMFEVAREIGRLPLPHDDFVGDAVFCLTALISEPYPAHSVIPRACHATWERRLLPGEMEEALLAALHDACARAGAPDTAVELALAEVTTWTGTAWREPKWYPAWRLAPEDPLVARALAALRTTGLEPRLAAYQFCTNAAYSAGVARVPTLGFGPGHEAQAHVVDEFVTVDELECNVWCVWF